LDQACGSTSGHNPQITQISLIRQGKDSGWGQDSDARCQASEKGQEPGAVLKML
jgi:hypothetical protein